MRRDAKIIWNKCLNIIKDRVEPLKFRSLFKPIVASDYNDPVLTLEVASDYICQTLESDYLDVLKYALVNVVGEHFKLEYSIVLDSANPNEGLHLKGDNSLNSKVDLGVNNVRTNGLKNPFEKQQNVVQIDSRLNPHYTLQSFIEGDCNRLARQAGLSIALSPGTTFNPLLIYGHSGLGKTHLAQAIGLEVKKNYPNKSVLYLTAHEFQTQFVEAQFRNEINDFIHFYQLIDVLILDDIHEFAGKPGTQKTFFHIFNSLHQSGKQIIMTCDKAPSQLEGMEERLLTRFKWGLPAEIKVPNFETRKKIVLNKTDKDGIVFDEDIINYVCKYVNSNVRELEGVLLSLLARSTFSPQTLTIEGAKEILANIVKHKDEKVTIDKIKSVVCDYYKLKPEVLERKSRLRAVVQARQLSMYLSKRYTNSSLSCIGTHIGKKNHATVLYSCKVVENMLVTDKDFKNQVEEVEKKLYV